VRQLLFNIRNHSFDYVATIRALPARVAVLLQFSEKIRVMVGLAPNHYAVDML
jgi:hypothetical protein